MQHEVLDRFEGWRFHLDIELDDVESTDAEAVLLLECAEKGPLHVRRGPASFRTDPALLSEKLRVKVTAQWIFALLKLLVHAPGGFLWTLVGCSCLGPGSRSQPPT